MFTHDTLAHREALPDALRRLDRDQVLSRFGEPDLWEKLSNDGEHFRYRLGEAKDILLVIKLVEDAVHHAWIEIEYADQANASIVSVAGANGRLMACKPAIDEARSRGAGIRILRPSRLPDNRRWITWIADSLDATRWHRNVLTTEHAQRCLCNGQAIQVEQGPFKDTDEALAAWPHKGDPPIETELFRTGTST